MAKQQKMRMVTDILMTILLPVLMAYSLVGEKLHEWLGIIMFVLFIFHHLLNWRWHKNITKGSYPVRRILLTVINGSLLVIMIALPISGMMMAKYTLRFLNDIISAEFLRTVHLLASHWGFILMSLHLGLHWDIILCIAKKLFHIQSQSAMRSFVLRMITVLLCFYGAYSFVALQYGQYVLLQTSFVFLDFRTPLFVSLMERAAIMVLFSSLAYYGVKFMRRKPKPQK